MALTRKARSLLRGQGRGGRGEGGGGIPYILSRCPYKHVRIRLYLAATCLVVFLSSFSSSL